MNYFYIFLVVAGFLSLPLLYFRHRSLERERCLRHLLDQADALEKLLHRTRERMGELRHVVNRVPRDIAEQAHASLDTHDQVQQGLRNVLEHRLWISQHGLTASLQELQKACEAMDHAYARIATQLEKLDDAGSELADVTQSALEQAAREPASLTRQPSQS